MHGINAISKYECVKNKNFVIFVLMEILGGHDSDTLLLCVSKEQKKNYFWKCS